VTGWVRRRSLEDAEWRMERDLAESVRCSEPRCEAGVGETCRNLSSGQVLENQPAHARRIRDARDAANPERET
jgi:hypothetical protein